MILATHALVAGALHQRCYRRYYRWRQRPNRKYAYQWGRSIFKPRYLPYLISEGYLQVNSYEQGPSIYEINAKGHTLLRTHNERSEMEDT